MADTITQLNNTEEALENVKKEAEEVEKALYRIPTSISTSIELSSDIDYALKQLNEIKNMRISPDLDISQVKSDFSYIKNMVADINESAANIAINNFDTSTDEDTLKRRLNAAKQAFTTQLASGESVIDVISSIDSVMGEQIRNEIKNIDLLTARMRNVTENGLAESTDNLGLALGKNLGVQGYIEEIEALKNNIAEQKEYIAMTYTNGADGLSTQKSRLTDEFSTGASELEQYENEIKVLEHYTNELAEAEKLLAIAQDDVNSKLKESAAVGGVFTGYFDMTTLGDKAEKQLSKYSEVLDLISNPFLMQGSTEEVRQMFRDVLPSFDIEPVREQVKEIENQDKLLSDILSKQSELLSDTEHVTQRRKEWATSEEEINKLYETRDKYVNSQLDVAERLHSMSISDKEDRLLNLSNPKENAEYESYMTSVEQAILDTKELREEIIKAQNTMNTPSNGVQSVIGTLSEEHIQKLKQAVNIYENGLKANASGTDADLITSLAKYIEDVQRIAGQVENKLDNKVAVANEVLNTLRSDREQGIKFANDDTKENRYYQQVKAIKQIRSELETLQGNEKYILPNLNVEQLIQYRELINKLKLDLRSLEGKNAELVKVFNDRETQLPDTSGILYSDSLSKSKDINGDIVSTLNAIIKEASIVEKVAQEEREAAEAARIHAENEERVAEATKGIRESIKNGRQNTNEFKEIEYTEEEIRRRAEEREKELRAAEEREKELRAEEEERRRKEAEFRKQLDEGLKNIKQGETRIISYDFSNISDTKLNEMLEKYKKGLNIEKETGKSVFTDEQRNVLSMIDKEISERKLLRDTEEKLIETTKLRINLEDKIAGRGTGRAYKYEEEQLSEYDKIIERCNTILESKNGYLEKEKEITREKERQLDLERALNGDFEIDMGVEVPEGAFAKVFEEKEKENDKANKEIEAAEEKLKNDITNKVNAVLSAVRSAVNNVINLVRKVNEIFNRCVKTIVNGFKSVEKVVERILKLFGNFGDAIGKSTKNNNLLKGSFTELKSAIDLLSGAFKKLTNNEFIKEGTKIISSLQTLNVLIGTELTNSTIEWADNLERALGLDASKLINQMSKLNTEMYALGMSSADSASVSQNLALSANVISSVMGLDADTVVGKINSGMRGMSRSLAEIGFQMNNNEINAYLKSLKAMGGEYANIATNINELTEEQKAYVRSSLFMKKFLETYTVDDYIKSLDLVTGRIRLLKEQVAILKNQMSKLFMGLLNQVIMPITGVIAFLNQALNKLISKISAITGIDFNWDKQAGLDKGNKNIEDTTDALDDMTEAADKANGALDDLDHVSTMSDSGKNNNKFDYSKLLDLADFDSFYDELEKADTDYIERCKQKVLELLRWIKNKIGEFVKQWTGRIIDWDVIKSNLLGSWINIKDMFKNILSIARTTFGIIGGLLYSVFDDLDTTRLLFKFTKVLERVTKLVDSILKRIAPKIQAFYDKYLSKYVIAFGDFLEKKLDGLIYKLNDLIGWWEDPDNEGAIDDWFENLGKKFENAIKIISEVFTILKTVFTGGSLDDTIKMKDSSDNMWNMYQAAVSLHQILYDVLDIIKDIAVHIVDFNGDGSFTFDDIRVAIEKIKEKLDEVRKWLDENKESITNILSAVWDTIVKIGEAKFTIIKDLIKFIVDNEDTVVRVLNAIGELVKLAAEHPVIAFGVAVGGQLLGTGLKTLITATMWKTILGIGSKGTIATACSGIGTAITGAINKIKWGSVINYLDGIVASEWAATSSFGLTGAAAGVAATGIVAGTIGAVIVEIKKGIPQIKSLWDDAWLDMTGGLAEATDEAGNKVKVSTTNAKQWAYDLRSALEQLYGEKIPTDEYERALNLMIEDLRRTGDYTEKELDTIRQNIEKQYETIGSIDWFDDIAYKTENSEKVISGLVDELNNKTTELKNTTATNATSTANSVVSMTNRITRSCSSAMSSLSSLMNSILRLNSTNVNVHLATGSNDAGSRYQYNPKVKTLGFANGGVPKSGSLFMANENGQSELVGNFGGYTGVANQDMIITAMQNAMTNAMKNAGANNGAVNNYNFDICKSGMFVGDESAVRKLANMINNTNVSNRSNIANVGFSM